MDDARPHEPTDLLPRFSLNGSGLSAAEALEQWRAALAPVFEVGVAPGEDLDDFGIDFEAFDFGPLLLGHARGRGAQTFARDIPTVARSGVDHILVQAHIGGQSHTVFDGEGIAMGPGDILVIDMGRTLSAETRDVANLSLALPRTLLEPLVRDVDQLHGLHLAGGDALGGLLFDHIGGLAARASRMTSREAAAVTESTVHLVAGCLGPASEARDAAAGGIAGALLSRLRRSIDQSLGDPDLGPDLLIRRHGLSRARLYRLFEPLGGVAEHIRRRRLRRCFLDLSSPDQRGLKISEIAQRWGFGNEAAFSRAFKTRFGLSPSEVRRGGGREEAPIGPDGLPPPIERWMRDLMGQ